MNVKQYPKGLAGKEKLIEEINSIFIDEVIRRTREVQDLLEVYNSTTEELLERFSKYPRIRRYVMFAARTSYNLRTEIKQH